MSRARNQKGNDEIEPSGYSRISDGPVRTGICATIPDLRGASGRLSADHGPKQAVRRGFNRHDVKIVELFTADGVDVGEGVKLAGRESLQEFFAGGFNTGWTNHSSAPDQVHVMGDWGWATGSWSATPPRVKEASQTVGGTWGDVFVRQGGA